MALALVASLLVGPGPPGFAPIDAGPSGGTIWQGVIPSRYAPPDRLPSLVYLPPGVGALPSARYPLVVLLHGFPGAPYSFSDGLQLATVYAQTDYGCAAAVLTATKQSALAWSETHEGDPDVAADIALMDEFIANLRTTGAPTIEVWCQPRGPLTARVADVVQLRFAVEPGRSSAAGRLSRARLWLPILCRRKALLASAAERLDVAC